MKLGLFHRLIFASVLAVASAWSASVARAQAKPAGGPEDFNTLWAFHLGDAPGAEAPDFDISAWRTLDLPHDWSIEGRTSPDAPSAGGGGFFPTGIGWYRRTFTAPTDWAGKHVRVLFEGVYMNAEVWLNGVPLASHVNGFTPFRVELTPHLKPGATNVLAVRVDNSVQPNSRFYTGSGIYRPVHLEIDEAVHFVPDSVVVTTLEASAESAKLLVEATVRNTTDREQTVRLTVGGFAPGGGVFESTTSQIVVPPGSENTCSIPIAAEKPKLWSLESRARYQFNIRAYVGNSQVDSASVVTGIRTVRVSAERGFELNGKRVILNGGNVHHDHGPLGAAAFDDAERAKVFMLKNAGYNAVRTSHNPPSTAFLEACDDEGLLVINEAFDGWARAKIPKDYSLHFKDRWRDDLTAFVRRDRNHPSVVMWSIGNEVYERGNAEGVRIARELADHIRTLDRTRPVTIGLNSLGKNGDWSRLDAMFAPVEVAGYNYELGRHADDHVRQPARVIVASESYQNEVFANWRIARDHPYVIGDFVWSAQDYLGEAGIGRVFPPDEKPFPHWEGTHYPWHGAACGDIDLIGVRKPISHYRSIVWDTGEKLYAAVLAPTPDGRPWNLTQWSVPPALASWTWAGHEGKPLTVDVYSRHPSVRLYLDDTLLGEKPTTELEEFKARFAVTYVPGVLRAVGVRDGKEVETFKLETAGPVVALRLTPHDLGQLTYVTVEAVDAQGRINPQSDLPVKLLVTGPGELKAFGSGDLTATEPYNADLRRLHQGRALAIIRADKRPGEISITAQSEGAAPITGRVVIERIAALPANMLNCPPIFSDHMVLQRDRPIIIWGDAFGPAKVTVRFAGQERTVKVGPGYNRWQVTLDPLPASAEPRDLVITADSETLTFRDVLVGEVWLCSGQSNMEKPFGPRGGQKPTDGTDEELAAADRPLVRLFQVPQSGKPKAKNADSVLRWLPSSADALRATEFSAAGYVFARELSARLGVPVGIIHASFGGTQIEAWMPPAAFASDPALRDLEAVPYFAWVKGVQATELYHSMIEPLTPFTLRGFLWYQGEANVMQCDTAIYTAKQRALIATWREAFRAPDAAFHFALLAPFTYSKWDTFPKAQTREALPAFWEAQLATTTLKGVHAISTTDLAGNAKDIHPTNKRDVGLRFARLALSETYGQAGLDARSPRFASFTVAGDGAVNVRFEHVGTGLTTRDGAPPTHFALAGEDRVFHEATATLAGPDTVTLRSAAVAKPVAVRFAWDETANPNLTHAGGLPALPFRTDTWPVVVERPKVVAEKKP